MNKQIAKIEEYIAWYDTQELSEEACVLFIAMFDDPKVEADATQEVRKVEIRSHVEGYDEELSRMLVRKMIDVPLLKQVFLESLQQVDVSLAYDDFLKWRQRSKYDQIFPLAELPDAAALEVKEGETAAYVKQTQEFCEWMSAKPSRNLSLLLLVQDELNSPKTTFAMGYPPEIATMIAKELKENYPLIQVIEAAMFMLDQQATVEEFAAWKDYLKKKK